MGGPVYDIGTLLRLKSTLPCVIFDNSKLNKHEYIAVIARLPEQLKSDSNFTTTTKSLATAAPSFRRRAMKSSETTTDSETGMGPLQARATHQWHYRRRDSTDRSHQPHSAPTGIAAQQSENFQRFYRAVVSPTHVRVTAGGRIVPNNRAAPPPALQWNGDRLLFEPSRQIEADPKFDHLFNHSNMGSLDGVAELEPPVRLSHPAQFDNSKPFMYNGQIVYPMPQHGPMAPPFPVSMFGGQSNYMLGHPMPLAPHGGLPVVVPPFGNGISPPIMASDMTRAQITAFRNYLDQLQHQPNVDMTYLEHQRHSIEASINAMETLLTSQLAQEQKQEKQSSQVGLKKPIDVSNEHKEAVSRPALQKYTPETKSEHFAAKFRFTADAPSFQPRAQAPPFTLSPQIVKSSPGNERPSLPHSTSASLVQSPPTPLPAVIENRLVSSSQFEWGSATAQPYLSLPKASTTYVPESQPITQLGTSPLKRSKTVHGSSQHVDTQDGSVIASNAMPYLVGSCPAYANERGSKPVEYVYSRPLTDEENRARYLYWGKAPRSVQSGLPKFDGKDFYPASPIKKDARPSSSHTISTSRALDAKTPAFNFAGLFASPGVRPKTPPPMMKALHESNRSSSQGSEIVRGGVPSVLTNGSKHQAPDSYSHLFAKPGLTTSDHDEADITGLGIFRRSGKSASFAERVAKFSTPEHHTRFLHNMLKNNAQLPSPAVGGSIISATGQGFLPQYRGTAIASLAPTMVNVPALVGDLSASRKDSIRTASQISSSMSENRPLFERSHDRYTEPMDAASYMRHLAQVSSSSGSRDGKENATGWV